MINVHFRRIITMSSESISYVQQQPRWLSRIKALYISTYLAALMAGTGYALFQLFEDPQQWGWAGVLMTTLPFLSLLARAFLFQKIARTQAHISANLIWGGHRYLHQPYRLGVF